VIGPIKLSGQRRRTRGCGALLLLDAIGEACRHNSDATGARLDGVHLLGLLDNILRLHAILGKLGGAQIEEVVRRKAGLRLDGAEVRHALDVALERLVLARTLLVVRVGATVLGRQVRKRRRQRWLARRQLGKRHVKQRRLILLCRDQRRRNQHNQRNNHS
jgi:hypothetical protein